MNKRSMFYIIDAFVFISLVLSAVFLLPPQGQPQNPIQFPSSYIAKDMMNIIEEYRLDEIENQTWVTQQVNDGNITITNRTILITLGALWAQDNINVANQLINQIFANRLSSHLGYGIWIDDEGLFATTNPPTARYSNSWRVVSGVEKAKPFDGFIANARASTIVANSTLVVSLSPEGAGWEDGHVNITKYFDLEDFNVIDAEMTLSVHADQNDNDLQIDINNDTCKYRRSDITWLFGTNEGNVGTQNITNCLQADNNSITLRLNNDAYNSHLHPGLQLVINYSTNITLITQSASVSERYYFDHLRSDEGNSDGSGVWQSVPFFIPNDAQNINVSMQVVGQGVRDYTGATGCDVHHYPSFNTYCGWFIDWDSQWDRVWNFDYLLFVNDDDPVDNDGSPAANPTYNYDSDFMGPLLINGTNVVSVYFNNYGDFVWGNGNTILYSDPINDPAGSSYIEVNYTTPTTVPFGMIEITQVEQFTGPPDNDATVSFNYPTEAQLKGDVFLHPVQQFSYLVTVWADIFDPPTTQVFRSPAARAVPSSIYIDNDNFDISAVIGNFVRIRDDNGGNDIINLSTIEYSFYIPSFVGYGDVYALEADAISNAEERLDNVTGPFLSLSDIVTTTNAISKVPTLWGPAVVEVRVWE